MSRPIGEAVTILTFRCDWTQGDSCEQARWERGLKNLSRERRH